MASPVDHRSRKRVRNISYSMRMKIVEAMSNMARKLSSGERGADRFSKRMVFVVATILSFTPKSVREGWRDGAAGLPYLFRK